MSANECFKRPGGSDEGPARSEPDYIKSKKCFNKFLFSDSESKRHKLESILNLYKRRLEEWKQEESSRGRTTSIHNLEKAVASIEDALREFSCTCSFITSNINLYYNLCKPVRIVSKDRQRKRANNQTHIFKQPEATDAQTSRKMRKVIEELHDHHTVPRMVLDEKDSSHEFSIPTESHFRELYTRVQEKFSRDCIEEVCCSCCEMLYSKTETIY